MQILKLEKKGHLKVKIPSSSPIAHSQRASPDQREFKNFLFLKSKKKTHSQAQSPGLSADYLTWLKFIWWLCPSSQSFWENALIS